HSSASIPNTPVSSRAELRGLKSCARFVAAADVSAPGAECRQRERAADAEDEPERAFEVAQDVVECLDERVRLLLGGDERGQDLEHVLVVGRDLREDAV